jgi:hypothetical protein
MNGTKDLRIQETPWGETILSGQCRYNNNEWDYTYSEMSLDGCLGDEHGKILLLVLWKGWC